MDQIARCRAAGSLTSALKRAVRVIATEYRFPREFDMFGLTRSFRGSDCSTLRQEWEGVCKTFLERYKSRAGYRRWTLEATLKSVKRMFDVPCEACDALAALSAREAWVQRVGVSPVRDPCDWCHSPEWLLERRVRELCSGWGERLKECREEGTVPRLGSVYVPDQQGCFETTRWKGGTLATSPNECTTRPGLVRVGVAKTKGKHRVVTMQSARVKRTLSPVHNALYDHITSFGWCVRGDVKKEDFEAVWQDRRRGEGLLSGDYSSATDNIYHWAVDVIVRVIAEESALTDEERSVLVESFLDLAWVSEKGGSPSPIKRGSMMGNLVSFPLLCLLNKACYDISVDIVFGSGTRRVGRFNGDDCMFASNRQLYDTWRRVTSTFGLIVNEEKTGWRSDWLELNSQLFLCQAGRFVPKPVISFLRPRRDEVGDLLSEVMNGIVTFSQSTQLWIVNEVMRYEISLRPISYSSCTKKWWKILLKRSWFRVALQKGPAPVRQVGEQRTVPVVVGIPPREAFYDLVDVAHRDIQADMVEYWQGRRVKTPYRQTIIRSSKSERKKEFVPRCRWKLGRVSSRWSFIWPRELYAWVKESCPQILMSDEERRSPWAADHPFLHVSHYVELIERPWFERFRKNFAPRFWLDYPLGYQ